MQTDTECLWMHAECPSDYAINTYTYIVLCIKRATYTSYCLFKYLLWMVVFIIRMYINTCISQRFVMQFESVKDAVILVWICLFHKLLCQISFICVSIPAWPYNSIHKQKCHSMCTSQNLAKQSVNTIL